MSEEKVAEMKVSKTPEEVKAEEEQALKDREKRFYDDPFSFVEMKDLLAGAIDTPDGVAIYVGKGIPRPRIEIAQSRLNFAIFEEFMIMKVAAMKKAQQGKRIVEPGRHQKQHGAFGNPFKRK